MSELKLSVRYAETDAMGVAHHSAYVVWMEAGRVAWLKDRGMSYRDLEAGGINLAVSNLTVDYRTSAKFDDEVIVETRLVDAKSRRVRFDYELRLEQGHLLASGSSTHTPTSQDGRAIRLPPAWLELLQTFLAG